LSVLVFFSQPSAMSPLQFPNPEAHAAILHTPLVQRGVPFATRQTFPQRPQFVTSYTRSRHRPEQSVSALPHGGPTLSPLTSASTSTTAASTSASTTAASPLVRQSSSNSALANAVMNFASALLRQARSTGLPASFALAKHLALAAPFFPAACSFILAQVLGITVPQSAPEKPALQVQTPVELSQAPWPLHSGEPGQATALATAGRPSGTRMKPPRATRKVALRRRCCLAPKWARGGAPLSPNALHRIALPAVRLPALRLRAPPNTAWRRRARNGPPTRFTIAVRPCAQVCQRKLVEAQAKSCPFRPGCGRSWVQDGRAP
jgi:hypothetical protein